MDAFGEQTLKKDRQCMLLAWLPRPSTEGTIVNCQYSTDKDFWRVNNIAEAIIINAETIASALLTWQEGVVWFRVLKIFKIFYFFKLILF